MNFAADQPVCPKCGGDLKRATNYPQGVSDDGTRHQALACFTDALYFGQAPDGSWTVPLMPVSRHV